MSIYGMHLHNRTIQTRVSAISAQTSAYVRDRLVKLRPLLISSTFARVISGLGLGALDWLCGDANRGQAGGNGERQDRAREPP